MARNIVAIACISAALIGCAATPPPPPVPVIERVVVDCTAQLPDWVFEPLPVPWMQEVADAGGTNQALLGIFSMSRALLEAANLRFLRIQELLDEAREECREH